MLRPRTPEDDLDAPPAPLTPLAATAVTQSSDKRKPKVPTEDAGSRTAPDRLERIREYRSRQQGPAATEGASTPIPGAPGAPGEPGPPQAPTNPPANNWIPIGPSVLRKGQTGGSRPTSGRVMGIAAAAGGNRVYLGSSNGGVWRSDDAGRSWRSMMDAFDLNPTAASSDSLSCGAIAISPSNPDLVFVGTGDGDEGKFLGVGPVVSTDGGSTWATEPVAAGSPTLAGSAFYALAVDPGDPNRVVAGTRSGLYRREPSGVGFAWARKANPAGFITSVVVARSGPTTRFFAARQNGGVFTSTDGDTWSAVGSGFPAANVGRVGLAVPGGNPNVLYAFVAASDGSPLGVFRLDGAAGPWRPVTGVPADVFGQANPGFQGWYDLAIAVDANDPSRIYLGGATRKSSDNQWAGAIYRCSITATPGPPLTYAMTATSIGDQVHADSHALAFVPGSSSQLWLGCDGGAFFAANASTGANPFVPRNTGLQILEMTKLAQHPTESAVVFCGTQDNGGGRFTGEEAWLHSVWGDCGQFIVNWADPYRILASYVGASVNRNTDGGVRYNYASVSVPIPAGDQPLFYAPLVGTPPSATAADAERVAFGSRRLWISDNFATSWTDVSGDLLQRINSLRFASATRVYAGTTAGRVYRFDRSGTSWLTTRLDNVAAGPLALSGAPISSIAVDPFDATLSSIFVTFAGHGDFRHVWRFDGTSWTARSGTAASATALLDVSHNAIVCDPANSGHVYVGADIGIWRSTDGGLTWNTFSSGLPDAGVLDLLLHPGERLLRAATYGRGVWEYQLDRSNLPGVELYVRDTSLDLGRHDTIDFLNDPTKLGTTVRHWAGPDIRVDTPDSGGSYQFPVTPGTTIDFTQFTDELTDDFENVATVSAGSVTTRVYVQVHNRGIVPANGVHVMLLVANASAGLPSLPVGYAANVASSTPITTASWRTVGTVVVDDVRVGFPRIAAFDLPSSMLPPPASLNGNAHVCVLALIHHLSDPFVATETVTDLLSLGDRKAAHKNLHVVQFSGTLPPSGLQGFMVELHNPFKESRVFDVKVGFGGYPGEVRFGFPKSLELESLQLSGARLDARVDRLKTWATDYVRRLDTVHAENHPHDPEWTSQRRADVIAMTEAPRSLLVVDPKAVGINGVKLAGGQRLPMLLIVAPPVPLAKGKSWPIAIHQVARDDGKYIGGLSGRLEQVSRIKRLVR